MKVGDRVVCLNGRFNSFASWFGKIETIFTPKGSDFRRFIIRRTKKCGGDEFYVDEYNVKLDWDIRYWW